MLFFCVRVWCGEMVVLGFDGTRSNARNIEVISVAARRRRERSAVLRSAPRPGLDRDEKAKNKRGRGASRGIRDLGALLATYLQFSTFLPSSSRHSALTRLAVGTTGPWLLSIVPTKHRGGGTSPVVSGARTKPWTGRAASLL